MGMRTDGKPITPYKNSWAHQMKLCKMGFHKERMRTGSVADGTHCVRCGKDMEPPTQWPRR
jgi:hypothetical protein